MMLQFAIVTYGFLLMFVLSAAGRNKREGRSNPMILIMTGYVLCGPCTIIGHAGGFDPAGAATLTQL